MLFLLCSLMHFLFVLLQDDFVDTLNDECRILLLLGKDDDAPVVSCTEKNTVINSVTVELHS